MKTISLSIFSSLLISSALFGTTLKQNSTNNSLIVYNSNVGLVHESRDLKLKKSDTQIIYDGVASTINPDSVNITLPKGVTLLSQQYRFDKLTHKKLLNAHIGKTINIKINNNPKKLKVIKAILLSNDGSTSIVKADKNIISVDNKNIIFKKIPNELITKPSLVWNVTTTKDISSTLDIDYLISQISWRSNYILNLKNNKADLSGWITINNRSGKAFKDTTLHLLAGDINRASQPKVYKARNTIMAVPQVQHKALEGYHFYTIPFEVNISNNEKTQIKFITQNNINIKRKYSSMMLNPNFLQGEQKHDVNSYITLKGMKYPLPKGVVRTYAKQQSTNILLGESYLKHTPKDTPISLKIGKNFDVKITETLLNRDDKKYSTQVDINYSLKNTSDESKTIEIFIPFNKNKDSKIKTNMRYTFTKGNLVTLKVTLKPKQTKEFKINFTTKKRG